MADCVRCPECEGADHHWIDNPDFAAGPEPATPQGCIEHPYVCKHCGTMGDECRCVNDEDEDGSEEDDWGLASSYVEAEPDPDCPECKGEGVLVAECGGQAEHARRRLISRVRSQLREIAQLRRDVGYWNENVRPQGVPPLDPDPDGELARWEAMLARAGQGQPRSMPETTDGYPVADFLDPVEFQWSEAEYQARKAVREFAQGLEEEPLPPASPCCNAATFERGAGLYCAACRQKIEGCCDGGRMEPGKGA